MISSLTGFFQIIHPQFKLSRRHFQETPVCRIQNFLQILPLHKGFQIHTGTADIACQTVVQFIDPLMLRQNLRTVFHFWLQNIISCTVSPCILIPLLLFVSQVLQLIFSFFTLLHDCFQIRFWLLSDLLFCRSVDALRPRQFFFVDIDFLLKHFCVFCSILLCQFLPFFFRQITFRQQCLVFRLALPPRFHQLREFLPIAVFQRLHLIQRLSRLLRQLRCLRIGFIRLHLGSIYAF